MIPTKTRGWRTLLFGERVVEIRKLQPKSGISLDQTVAEGLRRGYRYLVDDEVSRLLVDAVKTPGYLVIPSNPWTVKVYVVLENGTVRPTIRLKSWVEASGVPFSVLMAED